MEAQKKEKKVKTFKGPKRLKDVHIRMTDDEYVEVKNRIRKKGYKRLAQGARNLLLGRTGSEDNSKSVPEINREAWVKLAPLSSNINQVAEHLNKGNIITPGGSNNLLRDVTALREEVRQLRLSLVGAGRS